MIKVERRLTIREYAYGRRLMFGKIWNVESSVLRKNSTQSASRPVRPFLHSLAGCPSHRPRHVRHAGNGRIYTVRACDAAHKSTGVVDVSAYCRLSLFSLRRGAKHCNECVCLSVCLSARIDLYRASMAKLRQYFVPVGSRDYRSSSLRYVMLTYVLPVSWMTSCCGTAQGL